MFKYAKHAYNDLIKNIKKIDQDAYSYKEETASFLSKHSFFILKYTKYYKVSYKNLITSNFIANLFLIN